MIPLSLVVADGKRSFSIRIKTEIYSESHFVIMKLRIAIIGASGHAMVVADVLRQIGDKFEVIGFLDDVRSDLHGTAFCGARILGGRDLLDTLKKQGVGLAFVAIGDCAHRLRIASEVLDLGFRLPTLIHPKAVVADDVSVGIGSVVMAGSVINPGSRVGNHAIINTNATVDHECVLEDGVHVSPGVNLAGGVHVGEKTWIGIGASVKNDIRIGRGAVIGAGAVVLNDIPDHAVAYGVPARIARFTSSASQR